ncbi:universal stress protein [Chitinophaga horti]|uniref:Universal stress protein n=1 Tax=Chitinophaga horti TaxID=2920382 RepID=A0ABY6IYR0_9BACT|nr:universal stress protein [Chitinophaga horti]UYQ92553.1 universal stress protein [Chitinophaga horti]
MKTIIVPTDFSETAYNAARYALQLATQLGAGRVLLYHAYELIVPIPDLPTAVPMVDIDELKGASLDGLNNMKNALAASAPAGVVLDGRAENHLLAANLDNVCREEGAEVVVMGITGGSQLEEILVGSNTVDVVKNSRFPVIVVPTGATFKPVRKIAFACNLRNVVETTPIGPLKGLLDLFKAELHVVNVSKDNKENEGALSKEGQQLDELLKAYAPQYHFLDGTNVVDAVTGFAEANGADLILIVPRKHGLFESIFKRSNSSKFAFHTTIPLLSIHQ